MADVEKIKTMLIDDEEGALNTLSGMIAEFCPEIQIIGTARSISDAVHKIETLSPELIFLDIEMPPYGNGFDILRLSSKRNFEVIFTTAYPQFAIKAINEVQPLAYLVKPFSVSDLIDAIKTTLLTLQKRTVRQDTGKNSDKNGLIISDTRKGKLVLKFTEIWYCKADGNLSYLYIFRNNKLEKITTSQSLGQIEKSLPESVFTRIHNSYIVNLSCITRFEHTGRNGLIHLQNGITVPVSVKKMNQFMDRFHSTWGQ